MKRKSPLDQLAQAMTEADRNFTSVDNLTDFLISDIIVEDVYPHVIISSEINNQLTWREYPDDNFEFPETACEQEAVYEMDRDFIDSNISADGFLMSKKAKSILEKFDLGNHKFYGIKIIVKHKGFLRKREIKDYYWLHLICDENKQDFIDFQNSVFIVRKSKKGKELSRTEMVFKSKEEWNNFRIEKHQEWLGNTDENPFYKISAKNIVLRKRKIPDILGLGRVIAGEKFFSLSLARAVRENKLTGLNLKGTSMIFVDK